MQMNYWRPEMPNTPLRLVAAGAVSAAALCGSALSAYAVNVPESETISGTAGSYTLSAPASIGFPAKTVSASNQIASVAVAFDASDLTASGSGWKVTATSTTLQTGGATPAYLPLASVTETHTAFACTGTSTCTLPASDIAGTYALPDAHGTAPTATNMFYAAANSGMGDQNTTATFNLGVPSNSVAGSYTATATFSMVVGP